jgi:predicted alpha/beta superfamily hydrolase
MPKARKPTAGVAQPFTLPHAEAFEISSTAGSVYRISVGFPRTYRATDRTYPVLYLLDADYCFSTVLEISRNRASVAEIGEIVVVGIGYPLGTDLGTYAARRIYDFSTPDWDPTTRLFREFESSMAALGQSLRTGGAHEMLEFVTEELQPIIHDRYRCERTEQGLFGWSASGNFLAHVLLRRPEAFSKYIAASPAFFIGDGNAFRLEEEYAAGHDDLPVTLYLAAGSDETTQFARFPIVSDTARMAETLTRREYPGLRLTAEFLPGKTHLTAGPEIMQRGLEVCWPGAPYEFTLAHYEEFRLGDFAQFA